jgi:16S rRNA processing protein RimM
MTNNSYLHVGDILGAHGLKGALTVFSYTRPVQAIAGYCCWRLGQSAENLASFQVRRCWQHGKRMLVELEGITDCEQAEALKGLKIWAPRQAVEVEDDEFLWQDLIGCEVVDGGTLLGNVIALEEYGAQDILIVRTPEGGEAGGEWMLPFIKEVIVDVDLEQSRITVDLPDGMDSCFTSRF